MTEVAAAVAAWFGTGQPWSLIGSLAEEELCPPVSRKPSSHSAPPGLGEWRPVLRGPALRDLRPHVRGGVGGMLPGGCWPLPCAVATNPKNGSQNEKSMRDGAPRQLLGTTSSTSCSPASPAGDSEGQLPERRSGPRRRRDWKLLQGVWSEVPGSGSSPSSSALFGLTAPAAVPEGMRVLRVDGTLDSGAEAVVAPRDTIPGQLRASAMSKSNKQYRAANGSRIRNFGETKADFRTEEGHVCSLTFQIADVERVLIGVTPLTSSGHEVRLGEGGGEILHVASGRKIALRRKGGVFHLPMYFLVPDEEGGQPQAQDFTRQGA